MRANRLKDVGPAGVGLFVAVVAIVFVLARLLIAADGDVSRFVVAGSVHTDAGDTPVHLYVFDTAGYDGQFYWRLAVDPSDLHLRTANGVRFDDRLRVGRIAYPTIAWAASLGQASWAATTLVVINVAALATLGWAAAAIAVRHGRRAWWGLLAVTATGLVFSLSRDLNEVVMAAGVVAGIAALQARRPWWVVAACWSLAALAHEQTLYVVGAYGVVRLWRIATRRARFGLADGTWILPIALFSAWQSLAAVQVGGWPVLSSGSASVGAPFVGLGRELWDVARGNIDRQDWLVVPQLLAAAAMVAAAAKARRGLDHDDRWIAVAVGLGAVLAVCLSFNVWGGPADLRQVALLPTVAGVAVISSSEAWHRLLPWMAATAWVLTAGLRVVAI